MSPNSKRFFDVKRIANTIEGWLTTEEAKFLFETASKLKNKGVIVEIGSYKGKSTAFIGNGAKLAGVEKPYCVDPHIGSEKLRQKLGIYNSFEQFQQNCITSGVDDIVHPIVDISENAIKNFTEKIEFLFIDGDHSYEAVKLDFELWNPLLINGGIISFHDTNLIGPRKVVWEYVINSKHFKNVGRANSIIYAEKVEQNSVADRIANKFAFFSLYSWFATKRIKKSIPEPIKKMLRGK